MDATVFRSSKVLYLFQSDAHYSKKKKKTVLCARFLCIFSTEFHDFNQQIFEEYLGIFFKPHIVQLFF